MSRVLNHPLRPLNIDKGIGLDVQNLFFSEQTAQALGTFDVINMGEVLEHIPNPIELLKLVHCQLNADGLVCIIVPNDFNPFQMALRDHLGFNPWWVVPPHHINYFDLESLTKLVESAGFEVVHKESTFPIDMFLLMGDNYIGNDALGRECHSRRMNLEKNLAAAGHNSTRESLYKAFADVGLGREIVIVGRKMKRSI